VIPCGGIDEGPRALAGNRLRGPLSCGGARGARKSSAASRGRLLQGCCNFAALAEEVPANRIRGLRGSARSNSRAIAGISRFFAVAEESGEGGIRTHEAAFTAHAISSRAP
jgi:hypothetical protein